MHLWFFLIVNILLLTGCNTNNSSVTYINEAKLFCEEQNGSVKTVNDKTICQYSEEVEFDDGYSIFTHQCDVVSFYENLCHEDEPVEEAPLFITPIEENSVGMLIDKRVKDILNNLDNTGYSHDRNDNFSLHPTPFEFNSTTQNFDSYNLFLDCSGFVGYFVLQSIDPRLFNEIPLQHSCGDRPLAADFADIFKTSPVIFEDALPSDIDNNNTCWGQVLNLEDAQAGDIIVYAHSENLTDHVICSDTGKTVVKGTCTDPGSYYADNNLTCNARKNTGHVLYITSKPYKSTKCKDRDDDNEYCGDSTGLYQWVVPVADSTTSPHSKDSRGAVHDSDPRLSNYYNVNPYIAWNRGYYRTDDRDYDLERCEDNETNTTFHRHCQKDYNMTKLEEIVINTTHHSNPTGIGAGHIYVNNAMDGFRSRYGAKIERADIYIGRVIKCEE